MIRCVSNINLLLEKNKDYVQDFKKSSLMQLLEDERFSQQSFRYRFLDCIQVFSNYFQRTIMLRYALCDHAKFMPLVETHLNEEFGHNTKLMRDRNFKKPTWDPILEATASWFAWKMFTLGEEEKTVIVHLVLETSANIFFKAAHKIMQQYNDTNYFEDHAVIDEHHQSMGLDLLQDLKEDKYKALLEVQDQAWDMLNTVCNRIAELTVKE